PRAHLLRDRAQPDVASPHLDALAAAFVEREVRTHGVGMLLAEPRQPDAGADLLVGRRDEDHVACGTEAVARERRERDRGRGDLALHVERAASPYLAVDELAAEGVSVPLRG